MSEEYLYHKNEAKKSFDKLQQKLDSSEEEKAMLKDEIIEAKSQISELQHVHSKNSHNNQINLQQEEKMNELSKCVANLEDQLKEQEQEALDTVEQWQSACSDLETKCVDLECEIKECQEVISNRAWSIEQLKSCNESYVIQIEYLKAKFAKIEEEIVKTEAVNSRLVQAQEVERMKSIDNQLRFQAEIQAEREKNSEVFDQVEILTSRIKEIRRDSEDKLNQWTGMYIVALLH